MRKNMIVFIVILAFVMGSFPVTTAIAGGGGGCSGEDEDQCLAVVFGTAAVMIIVVGLMSGNTEKKTPEPPGRLSLKDSPLPAKKALAVSDLIAQNGEMVMMKW